MHKRGRFPVAILGATGTVGQRFIQLLQDHPWFKVVALTASDRSVGKKYSEACHWILPDSMPDYVKNLPLVSTLPIDVDTPLVFSALPASAALEAEPLYAKKGIVVCSNASAYRQEPDIPLLLPEINPEHTQVVPAQKNNRGWSGFIVANSNCTITGLTVALKPLQDQFGVKRAMIVSMQAISGAGYPGVASLDIFGNVIPYIPDEERRMEWEPRKMLGSVQGESLELADFKISAHANRVPVIEGHMLCVNVEFEQKASLEEVAQALRHYQAPEISRNLPSAPPSVILLKDEANRPQPRLDICAGNGMTTVVGRLRPDSILDYKMVILSHNTIRGAAGGSIYNAELLVSQGLL
jgi:aspartate-semialdehyde dehydrogenase